MYKKASLLPPSSAKHTTKTGVYADDYSTRGDFLGENSPTGELAMRSCGRITNLLLAAIVGGLFLAKSAEGTSLVIGVTMIVYAILVLVSSCLVCAMRGLNTGYLILEYVVSFVYYLVLLGIYLFENGMGAEPYSWCVGAVYLMLFVIGFVFAVLWNVWFWQYKKGTRGYRKD